MKIEVNIPALDRLCEVLEKMNLNTVVNTVAPTDISKAIAKKFAPAPVKEEAAPLELVDDDEPEVVTSPPVKTEPAKKPAKPKAEIPAPTKEKAPAPVATATVEELTLLAQDLIKKTDIPTLRAVLDDAGIKGEKISSCDKKFYPAIKLALQEKIASI